jgi:hypothetical protein
MVAATSAVYTGDRGTIMTLNLSDIKNSIEIVSLSIALLCQIWRLLEDKKKEPSPYDLAIS